MRFSSALSLSIDRIVTPVEGMHRAISSRWFRAIGPIARPIQFAHDTVSGVVYRAIRSASGAVGWGIETSGWPGEDTMDTVQAWVNGLWGDDLGTHRSALSIEMAAIDAAADRMRPAGTMKRSSAGAHSPTLVFLVHGLVEDERRWNAAAGAKGLVAALRNEGFSPVLIRYNTGLPIDASGTQLAALIERVVDGWSCPVERVALVGHSMGGLVARRACLAAATDGRAWIERVTDLVTIGTPHGGAPLERVTHATAWGLNLATVTRPLATFLNRRSRGIKDLRKGQPTDGASAALAHIRHHFVGGVLTHDPTHPIGSMFGDLMVLPSSSIRSLGEAPHNTRLVGGVNHSRLLDHPAVTEQVVAWLREAVPMTGPTGSPQDQTQGSNAPGGV